MRVTASAPGKLMLFGEHAVLHGYPCLVTSVDLRYMVSIELIDDPVISIQTPVLEERNEVFSIRVEDLQNDPLKQNDTKFILAVLQGMIPKVGYRNGFRIHSDGPIASYGLGSSSAISVATVRALSALSSIDLSLDEIFQEAFSAVLEVQKTGSGFDTAAATFGGTLRYQIGKPIEKLPVENIPVIIAFTGKKVSTVELVNKVIDSEKRNPNFQREIFQSIGTITESAQTAMLKQDWETVGQLADRNQDLLKQLGVSSAKIDKGVKAARMAGAYGAKLSGAGGGDCLFAICNDHQRETIEEALEKVETQVLHLDTDCEGVRLE